MEQTRPPESILIVDDTVANLRLLSQILRDQGYRVRAVSSGQHALASVSAELPDLILLDIRMPDINGYEVCRRLKEDSRLSEVPVLFISALNEIQDKVQAFAVGGVDYITKPFQVEEVIARVKNHLTLRSLQRDLLYANRQMQKEIALAAQVQGSMMRRDLPELAGWQIAVRLLPAKLTCGDFYDVAKLPDGKLAILIADVVDKGVGAALYMAMSCALLRSYLMETPALPEAVFKAVNHRILEDTQTDQFVTVFLGILDLDKGVMNYANAGHNPPALLRAAPDQTELLTRTGPALGIMEDWGWEQRAVHFLPGDTLILYTDGVVDAENMNSEFYGKNRLLKVAVESFGLNAACLVDRLLEDLRFYTGEAAQFDDILLMALRRADT